MRYEPQDLGPHEIAIYLATNDRISPASFGTLLVELEKLALQRRNFGPEAEVRIIDIGIGSGWAKLGIFFGGVAAGAAVWSAASAQKSADVAMAQYQASIEERAERGNSYLGQCLADMYLDNSVVTAEITTAGGQRFIKTSTLPSVDYVQRRRLNSPKSGPRYLPGQDEPDYLQTESGDYLTTETGEKIEVERTSPRKVMPALRSADRPIRQGDRFLYEANSDRRGAQSFVGTFERVGEDLFHFVTDQGDHYGANFDSQISVKSGWLPSGRRVTIRATVDHGNRSLVIFEFHPIDEL